MKNIVSMMLLAGALSGIALPVRGENRPRREVVVNVALPDAEWIPGGQGELGGILRGEGFGIGREAGDPAIPSRAYRYILPPEADPETVQVELRFGETRSLFTGLIGPAGETVSGDGVPVPREDGIVLEGGFNPFVYGSDKMFPASFLEDTRIADYRGVPIVCFSLNLAQWNPASGVSDILQQGRLAISWQDRIVIPELNITDLDEKYLGRICVLNEIQSLEDILSKYRAAESGSRHGVPVTYDYLVIATQEVLDEADENGVDALVDHLHTLGHFVHVEPLQSILGSYSKMESWQKIRQYIHDTWNAPRFNIRYILLIGNPDPYANEADVPDPDPSVVPMMRGDLGTMNAPYYLTDIVYSCLEETDNKGKGNHYSEETDGGIADFYVGRIAPCGGYQNDGKSNLREAINQIILYDREISKDWRTNMLVAASYLYGSCKGTSAKFLTETIRQIRSHDTRFYAYTVYQDGTQFGLADEWFDGIPNPEASAPLATREDDGSNFFLDAWENGQHGLMFWSGHGSGVDVAIGGGAGRFGCQSTSDGVLVTREFFNAASASLSYPSFVFSSSCNNMLTGASEYLSGDYDMQESCWRNLSATLQRNGAVGVAAYTYLSYGQSPGSGDLKTGVNSWFQRETLTRLAQNLPFGNALYQAKDEYWDQGISSTYYRRNYLRLNGLFQPSQRLFQSVDVFPDDPYETNNTRSTAACVYHGDGSATDISMTIGDLVSKDDDYFVLRGLSTDIKTIRVYLYPDAGNGDGMKEQSFDLDVEVLNNSGAALAVDGATYSGYKLFTESRGTCSDELYVCVKPGRWVRNYSLKIEVLYDDGCENNDTFASATAIGNITGDKQLEDLRLFDDDWYRFSVEEPVNEIAVVVVIRAKSDAKIHLYNADGILLAENAASPVLNAIYLYTRAFGTVFYVHIERLGGMNTYDLSFSITPPEDDEFDAGDGNDTQGDAADWMRFGYGSGPGVYTIEQSGLMCLDDDWYRLIVSDHPRKEVELTFEYDPLCAVGAPPAIELYDGDGNLLPAGDITPRDNGEYRRYQTTAREVFLRVSPGDYPAEYGMVATIYMEDDRFEDNDTHDAATAVRITDEYTKYVVLAEETGLVCRDDDWYWLPPYLGSSPHTLLIIVEPGASSDAADMAFTLFDKDLNEVGAGEDADGELRLTAADRTGAHYLRVYQSGSASYDYNLFVVRWEAAEDDVHDEGAGNDEPELAVSLAWDGEYTPLDLFYRLDGLVSLDEDWYELIADDARREWSVSVRLAPVELSALPCDISFEVYDENLSPLTSGPVAVGSSGAATWSGTQECRKVYLRVYPSVYPVEYAISGKRF